MMVQHGAAEQQFFVVRIESQPALASVPGVVVPAGLRQAADENRKRLADVRFFRR